MAYLQITALRYHLASLLEAEEDWQEAAKALSAIPSLDSSSRSLSDLDRLDTLVRIARLYLESDNPEQADVFLKRASLVQSSATAVVSEGSTASAEEQAKAKVLILAYKLSQARIYDAQRRFLEAAIRFHQLSYVTEIDDEDRTQML